jgi:hypothetical protein
LQLDQKYIDKNIGAGKWDGVIYDSFDKQYEVFGRNPRRIAERRVDKKTGKVIDTCESVHDSAIERFGQIVAPEKKAYWPSNLYEYLTAPGRPGLPAHAATVVPRPPGS